MTTGLGLRRLLSGSEMLVVPGAYDSIGARLIEQAGYPAVYMTGGGTSCAHGFPDYGLLTMGEMVDNAATMVSSVSIPLIADADTGYGNVLNVTRTVREFEARGVAAVHIEDQVSPKRCGHLDGKEVTPSEEFICKIRAAVSARRSPEFVVIARTDAYGVNGFEDAIRRANAALSQGADIAFVEGVSKLEEVEAVPRLVRGPCMLNLVAGGKTPLVTMQHASKLGYKITILPGMLLAAAIHGFEGALAELAKTGSMAELPDGLTISKIFARFDTAEWDHLRSASSIRQPT